MPLPLAKTILYYSNKKIGTILKENNILQFKRYYSPTSDNVRIQFSTLNLCPAFNHAHCDTLKAA